jgi:hypothetical protein
MQSAVVRRKIGWKWGAIVAIAMMLLSMYPQVMLWGNRGTDWNGFYAVIEGVGDEIAYSAYINALIDGRPRRNDPYTGRDELNDPHQPDSLFSIQFVPAYGIAFLARALGISAATVFIVLTPLAAGASSLALFWLLVSVIGHERLAAAGVVLVLCLGTLIGGHSHIVRFLGQEPLYNYLMFLRRYQPSATFPLFILFCATVWQAINWKNKSAALLYSILAAIIFELLIFSYFYLWTAAVAWLACVWVLWLITHLGDWRKSIKRLLVVAAVLAAELIPFAILCAKRATTLDSVQALEFSRRPDLFRLPELVAILVLVSFAYAVRRGLVALGDPRVVLGGSFAVLPFAVFNQQVITGFSLQPIHYEMFVANYSALIAVVLTIAVIFQARKGQEVSRISRKALFWVALAAFEWGAYETLVATSGSLAFGRELDESRPVAMRLAQLADRKLTAAAPPIVLASDLLVADGLPTTAPQATLWAPHMLVFSGVTRSESRERFYQYLYYTGIDQEQLATILTTQRKYGFAVGLFGFERTVKGLSSNSEPITRQELELELAKYAEYAASFTRERAVRHQLSYLVVPAEGPPNLANLDRWYARDGGERVSKFILYRLKLREQGAETMSNRSDNILGQPGA